MMSDWAREEVTRPDNDDAMPPLPRRVLDDAAVGQARTVSGCCTPCSWPSSSTPWCMCPDEQNNDEDLALDACVQDPSQRELELIAEVAQLKAERGRSPLSRRSNGDSPHLSPSSPKKGERMSGKAKKILAILAALGITAASATEFLTHVMSAFPANAKLHTACTMLLTRSVSLRPSSW